MALSFILVGCFQSPKPEHVSYVQQAFDSILVYSIRQEFNFDSLENSVLGRINGKSEIRDIHDLLHVAIVAIDRHSFLVAPENTTRMLNGAEEVVPESYPFSGKILKGRYGYVDLLPFSGVDSVSANNYLDSLQRLVLKLYNQEPTGWIIDLRTNTGGNPYAMVGGLGALLGMGTLATTISHEGDSHDYFYSRTDSSGKFEKLELIDSAYVFEKRLPISILIDSLTASAAEVLTLAFKGLEHTRVLGRPSYGVTTGLYPVIMPDSACMFITHSIDHDRFGNAYDGPIEPDELIEDPMELFERSYEFIECYESK